MIATPSYRGFILRSSCSHHPAGVNSTTLYHCLCRVACQRGHLAVIRQLLRYLHAVRCHDCCVLALSYTCSTSNTDSMRCVLESPYLPQQLDRYAHHCCLLLHVGPGPDRSTIYCASYVHGDCSM